MPFIPCTANTNLTAQKAFMGARETARAKTRAILVPRFSKSNSLVDFTDCSEPDVPLLIIPEGDGFGENTAGKFLPAPAGKYAYVTMLDGTIRVWPAKGSDLKDTDHMALSSFTQKVAYAGELEINGESQITVWSNASGTYEPLTVLNHQARLPLTKFKAHPDSLKDLALKKGVKAMGDALTQAFVSGGEFKFDSKLAAQMGWTTTEGAGSAAAGSGAGAGGATFTLSSPGSAPAKKG